MADAHAEVPVAGLEGLSLEEGVPTVSTVENSSSSLDQGSNIPIDAEDGKSDDGSECSEDEENKTVVGGNESVHVPDEASSTKGASGPAAQGPTTVIAVIPPPVRLVTIFPNAIHVAYGNGTTIMSFTNAYLDGRAKLNLACLNFNLVDSEFCDLVLTAHKGSVFLVTAVLSATGSRQESQETLESRFCNAERVIVSFRQALAQNGNVIENIPEDELNCLVSDIAQQVHGLIIPLISSINDVVAVLEFIKQSYLDICRLEIGSGEYKLAVESFNSGVATMMIYFMWAGNWYRHGTHSDPSSSDELKSLKWAELKTALEKVSLPLIDRRNTDQPDAPSAAPHRSYDFFFLLTRYVTFLGLTEEHIGWETVPLWVSKADALGEDAYGFLVTDAVTKFLQALAPAGLDRGTGAQVGHIPVQACLQTSQGVRIGRALV